MNTYDETKEKLRIIREEDIKNGQRVFSSSVDRIGRILGWVKESKKEMFWVKWYADPKNGLVEFETKYSVGGMEKFLLVPDNEKTETKEILTPYTKQVCSDDIKVGVRICGAPPGEPINEWTGTIVEITDRLDEEKFLKIKWDPAVDLKEDQRYNVGYVMTYFSLLLNESKQKIPKIGDMVEFEDENGIILRGHLVYDNLVCVYYTVDKKKCRVIDMV